MSLNLYQKDLLRWAATVTHAGRLDGADATATIDNPLCGDRITIDIKREGETVFAIAHECEACVLCQASASMLSATMVGHTKAEITALRATVSDMLKQDDEAPVPEAAGEYQIFAGVRPHTARHACIDLPFEALLDALDQA